LLARARAADADVARVREGATPAGEADPYRESIDVDVDVDVDLGAPTANGEGAGDNHQPED
jgi:ribosome-binding factor A